MKSLPQIELDDLDGEVTGRSLLTFAEQSLASAEFNNADFLPDVATVDFDHPKHSLMRHPSVLKAVSVVASVAATAQYHAATRFAAIHPDKFISTCDAALERCTEPSERQRIEVKKFVTKYFAEHAPNLIAEIRENNRIYRQNVEFAATTLLNWCRKLVSDWIEAIPTESLKTLLAEIERLQANQNLSAQLRWFGLGDMEVT